MCVLKPSFIPVISVILFHSKFSLRTFCVYFQAGLILKQPNLFQNKIDQSIIIQLQEVLTSKPGIYRKVIHRYNMTFYLLFALQAGTYTLKIKFDEIK